MKAYYVKLRLTDRWENRPSAELLEAVTKSIRRDVSSVDVQVEEYAEVLPVTK